MHQSLKQKGGFSLVELLVVIAIIGLLATIAIVATNIARRKAMVTRAQAEVRQIVTAIALLENDSGEWPGHKTIEDVESGGSGNEIWDLNVDLAGIAGTDGNFSGWDGPYMNSVPLDPWGNNYFFDTDYDIDPGAGQKWAAVVGSFGPNGVGQNVYDSDNIFLVLSVGE
ncbi:MAG: hypothetical protein COT81_05470 [Candidatus Buchananbacteria bacterium CG10_big_fil_rev_8_21_14_0_10_42_9]|uniref:Type II secretion system protein GspG C-terminal domain-containing protein n=1 Tax=Candidatus Buchananbacteria bacterium CG10_big_fil_rev_8_21_14_0_10_42_9 TaxID=1974526 RepID=A0A2H0VZV8_9BACT|nr:MAG: hypothetical protein COT81_05470 [Candidatus Buchananbacteria bacterium CG10_big_fil_rev_8_21_14_0_10_42_9]